MTIAPEELRRDEAVVDPDPIALPPMGAPDSEDGDGAPAERALHVPLVAGAAALSTAAAVWMSGALLRGAWMPRLLGLAGTLIGVGLVALGARRPRGRLHQLLVVPVAAVVGAMAVAPAATGGTANLPGLVAEALRGGGLLQPPLPFDPGWRFILVVLFAVVGAAALSSALASGKPKVAVLIPLPVAFGAGLVQPEGAELVSAGGAIVLLTAGLALSYGAQLAAEGSLEGGFEVRRLGRGLGMVAVLLVALVVLAQANLLFPSNDKDNVVPPRRPPDVPLEADRLLFTVQDDGPGPWRVGTLDGYDGEAWLLPPVSPKLVLKVDGGAFPTVAGSAPADRATRNVAFEINDVKGRILPVPGLATRLVSGPNSVEFETRGEVPRLEARLPSGLKYTVSALALPTARDLAKAPAANAETMREYGAAPPPPNAVVTLLAEAPNEPFERLQFMRDRLYTSVVAAGAGKPGDVPPSRVAEMLNDGNEATPYEITAAEALLARWAGIPSRIGFGYHGGQKGDRGFEVRPKNGAAWLEVWFEGYGWVPFVGTPPRAKASANEDLKLDVPDVLATEDIAMTVFVPFRRLSFRLLYETVRYWLVRLAPVALLLAAGWFGLPALAKRVRTRKRRRFALAHGALARIWVGYAELRDRCTDLNVGPPLATPLEFVDHFEPDREHEELAWIVTRAVWGDVRRDLRDEDAEVFEDLASSVSRRIAAGQGPINRTLGRVSTASLKQPYADDVPNVWWDLAALRPSPSSFKLVARRLRRLAPQRAVAGLLVVALFGASVVAAGQSSARADSKGPASKDAAGRGLLPRLVPEPPESLEGYTFVREPRAEEEYGRVGKLALVHRGRVFTIRRGTVVQGSVQEAEFDPGIDSHRASVQAQVEKAIGGGFSTVHYGTTRLRVAKLPQQRVVLWFPPERNVMVVFDLRRRFSDADLLVRSVIRYSRGVPKRPPSNLTGPAGGLGLHAPVLAGVPELPVGFWCGPPEQFLTPDRFTQMADAGFNYTMPPCEGEPTLEANRKTLDLAHAAGMKAFILDPRVLAAARGRAGLSTQAKGSTVETLVDGALADYSSHPAFAGFFLADEPVAKQFRDIGVVVRRLRQKDPMHPPFVNIFPSYAPDMGMELGAPTYDDYLRRYIEEVGPAFVSYDHYSLLYGRDRPGMYDNLDAVRRAAGGARLPFWQIVLDTSDEQSYRPLSESEKRYQAMHTLAYGGQGLLWFTYWQPPNVAQYIWGDALVNRDGTVTPQLAEVARINKDVRALSSWLYRAASVGVFQTGEVPPDGRGPQGTEPVRVLGNGDFTVGLFADGATRYALFANRDYKKEAQSDVLVLSGGVIPQRFDKATGLWAPVQGAVAEAEGGVRVPMTLAAGDAELLRW